MFSRLVIVIVASILSGCFATSPQYLTSPEAISSTGTFTHIPSGFTFPISVGEFQRAGIYKNDVEGKNIGVSYNLTNSFKPITVTIYIYLAPSITSIGSLISVIETARANLCRQEFEARKQEIMTVYPNAKQISSNMATAGAKTISVHNLSTYFEYEEIFSNVVQPELELSCYINDKWNVIYRVTHPKSLSVEQEINQLKGLYKHIKPFALLSETSLTPGVSCDRQIQ